MCPDDSGLLYPEHTELGEQPDETNVSHMLGASHSPHVNPAENLFKSFFTDALDTDLQHYPQNTKSWEIHYNTPTHYTLCTVIQLILMPDGVWRLLNTFLCYFK